MRAAEGAGGYERRGSMGAQALQQLVSRSRKISNQIVAIDAGPVAQTRGACGIQGIHAYDGADSETVHEFTDDAGARTEVEQHDLARVKPQPLQRLRQTIGRDLRRATSKQSLDDVLVEPRHAVDSLIVVQVDELVTGDRVADRDVLAVGLRRANQTHHCPCDRHPPDNTLPGCSCWAPTTRTRENVEMNVPENEGEPITEAGLVALQAEIDELETVGRREIAARIRTARAHGDLKENGEYHAAKEDQAHLETRILRLRQRRRDAVVVPTDEASGLAFAFGRSAEVRDENTGEVHTWTIVGAGEADRARGRLSVQSPVGKALLDQSPGSTVEVPVPGGTRRLTIQRIL